MGQQSAKLHEVSLKFYHQTEKAWLVGEGLKDKDGKEIKFWLPKSQVECDTDDEELVSGKVFVFTLPEWLVNENNITV